MAGDPTAEDDEQELFAEQQEQIERPAYRLFRSYAPERPLPLAVALATTVLSPLISLFPTYMLKVIIDSVLQNNAPYRLPLVPRGWLPTGQWEQILLSVGLILGSVALNLGVGLANNWGWHLFSEHVQHTLRTNSYDKMQRLGMEFFTNQRTGQILSILNNDVNELQTFLQSYVSRIIRITVQFLGIAVVLFSLKWQLALVTLLPVPVMTWYSFQYGSKVREKYGDIRQAVGTLHSRIENSVSGISVVKSYTQEPFESDRVEESSAEYFDARWDMLLTRITFFPVLNFMNWAGFALTLLVGGYWITVGPPLFFAGSLSIGTLVAFLTYNQQFTGPIIQIGHVLDQYEDARASIVRVFALTDYPVDVADADDAVTVDDVEGDLVFDDVTFTYPDSDEPVLDGVTIDVAAGEMVGLVGPTGAGKSTLVKLLLRFYDPDEGAVRIDGHDLRDVRLQSLRESIGYVSQDPFLFDGTVRENLRYAALDADDHEIEAAAKVANAHEFITDLDDGYETRVGERGVKLSGGQRQRVAIARAVLKDPDLLILDEATSHVDNETEVLIQHSLRDLIADRTTVAIAHRLSTVRSADQIVVLEDGEVTERGSHEELLVEDGLYATLWAVQVGQIEDLPEEFVADSRVEERPSG
ncbi:MAG: ABC transporter ATP-binding protein [Halobacteriaceae archaeon]